MQILGLDPGLRATGWGVIETSGTNLKHVANGVVRVNIKSSLANRVKELYKELNFVIDKFNLDSAAIEEVFVNKNPSSTLKLGQARGVAILVPALKGIPISEYASTRIKKAIVGVGHADKEQMRVMVGHILPKCKFENHDSVDALAVAICHSHYLDFANKWSFSNSLE